ncbi:ribosomal protein S5 domain 2-type protein, partial [Cladochytrium replicatum]
RADGRLPYQIRPPSSALGVLSRADGSARYSIGITSVLCSVYGPTEAKLREEKLDKAVVNVVWKPDVGQSGTRERLFERFIREAFSTAIMVALHPRTSFQITCQVMSDDGSTLAAAINAVSLALIDAGAPLRSVPGAICCAFDEDGALIVDPSQKEMERAKSVHTFAFENDSSEILTCDSVGIFSEEEVCHAILTFSITFKRYFPKFEQCAQVCRNAVRTLQAFMRTVVERKVQKVNFG